MKTRFHTGAMAAPLLALAMIGACGGDDDAAGAGGSPTSGSPGGNGGSAGTAIGSGGTATGTGGGAGAGAIDGASGGGAGGGTTAGGSGGTAGNVGSGGVAGSSAGGAAGSVKGGAAGQGGSSIVDAGGSSGKGGTATDAAHDSVMADARDAPASTPDVQGDGAAGCGLANVLSKSYFDSIFPLSSRNAVYTYEGLLAAADSYPAFANTGSLDACRQETAAFLANVARETGRLKYAEEIAKSAYCSTRTGCACDSSTTDQTKWYYGRGAIQITWNYNYCSAGTALSADLLVQPSLVHTDAKYAWATALWYWMTSKGGSTMTCHVAMTGSGAFGDTIRAINGGECGGGGYGSVTAVKERVDAYIEFAKGLGIADPGMPTDLDC